MAKRSIFLNAVKDGAVKGCKTALMLYRIVLPIYVAVAFLGHTGLYLWIADKFEPFVRIFGLPGEAMVPLIVGLFSDEYATVAAMSPFSLTMAHVTIIAMVNLYLHSIPVESVISQKIGIPPLKIAIFRIVMAVITGILVAYLAAVFLGGTAPEFPFGFHIIAGTEASVEILAEQNLNNPFIELNTLLFELGFGVIMMVLTILRVLVPMMIVIELMFVYNIVEILAKKLSPVCRLFAISKDALIPLLVGFLLGITYGAGAIMEINNKKPLSKRDLWLLGVFLYSCHGIIETTYLFAVAGGSAVFISGVRLLIAVIVTAVMARLPFPRENRILSA